VNHLEAGTPCDGNASVSHTGGVVISVIGNAEARAIGTVRSKEGDMPEKIEAGGSIDHGATIHVSTIGGRNIIRAGGITELFVDSLPRELSGVDLEIHAIEKATDRRQGINSRTSRRENGEFNG
jgi:hypothetical protein